MTEKQYELLNYLRACRLDPVPPSFEEMKNALGLASKSGVHRLVHSLAEQGHVYLGKKGHARRVQLADSNLAGIPTEVLAAEIERRSSAAMGGR